MHFVYCWVGRGGGGGGRWSQIKGRSENVISFCHSLCLIDALVVIPAPTFFVSMSLYLDSFKEI
jgi:hypothetical protein